ncbi:hypothetical protein [uncultured Endozoicomonas sp.]|uniref:hypothetical protein n=1 Tax=uncultured Endozoicomonas sp. TaxID=432652 RepID=UPI0026160880|nr:hypothetical protein [uncultured Endozoicomonas sp.]
MADIYNWPSELIPQENEFYLEAVTRFFESPFTGDSQTMEVPGAKWKAKLKFSKLGAERLRLLEITLLQLRGAANRIKITDHAIARAGVGGNATVDGAGQLGRVLMVKDATPSVEYLKTGDYFEVNGELKRMIADAFTDSYGKTSLRFEPALRKAPPNNSQVITDNPSAIFRLEKDSGSKTQRQSLIGNVTLNFVEVIRQ